MAKKVYDVKCGQQIKTTYLTITSPHHCVSFAATSLTIGETGSISTLESASDERLNAFFVNLH